MLKDKNLMCYKYKVANVDKKLAECDNRFKWYNPFSLLLLALNQNENKKKMIENHELYEVYGF